TMERQKNAPLLVKRPKEREGQVQGLAGEVWEESMKLWEVVGPAVFMRLVLYSLNIISQSFAGHLGDAELAAFSIASTVISGFNLGFLASIDFTNVTHNLDELQLGMASALETLCGQAYGAKQYAMLGVYMQRSWLVLLAFAALLSPTYIFSGQLLSALGLPADLAREAGAVSACLLPLHFMYAILLPLNKFLQCQRKNAVTAVTTAVAFPVHAAVTWLLVSYFGLGLIGAATALNFSWALVVALQFAYAVGGGCPETWGGFSSLAFVDIWGFVKLSSASGVMLCLESWYYRVLIFVTGYMKNAELAVDALSICLSLTGLEMMIPLGFLAGTGSALNPDTLPWFCFARVRVANELGAGNGHRARFATMVSTTTSFVISIFFCLLALGLHGRLALIFSSSKALIDAVDDMSVLLALTILLNGVQPVLSGVAVGSGWQALVAYVNIGSYYLIGVPFGVLLGWTFHLGVHGIWAGMIGGTTVQTLILAYMTIRCDWDQEQHSAFSPLLRGRYHV
uniref:Protein DETOXIFICATION n=1 Tax=Aegilops tauschii subsp. strangulata TaxID=200361 RepID=A0A453L0U4_AEGTS